MVYAYLLLIEDRKTHTCHPSYNTIAAVTELAKNTAMKSINTLLEMGLIAVEPSSYFDKRGVKWTGNNLYTILPTRQAVDQFHQQQLDQLELETARRHVYKRQKEYDVQRRSGGMSEPCRSRRGEGYEARDDEKQPAKELSSIKMQKGVNI